MANTDRVVPEVVLQMDTPAEWFWIDPNTAGMRINSGPCVYEIHFSAKTGEKSLVEFLQEWKRRPQISGEVIAFPQRAH